VETLYYAIEKYKAQNSLEGFAKLTVYQALL
jgi:hypothetical protein